MNTFSLHTRSVRRIHLSDEPKMALRVRKVAGAFENGLGTLRYLPSTKSGIKQLTSVVHLQPMPEESLTENQFEDATIGMNIPKNFIPSIEKVMNDV